MLLLYFCRLCLLSKLPSVSSTHSCIGHLPGENWAKYLEVITPVRPFTKLFCKTCKNGGSLPATAAAAAPFLPAAARVACTHTHICSQLQCALHTHTQPKLVLLWGWGGPACGISISVLQLLQYFIPKVSTRALCVCFNPCIAIEGMCMFTLCTLTALSLVLSNGINVAGTWEQWPVC